MKPLLIQKFDDVKLMRKHVGKDVKVKAAGGISSFADAEEFMRCGTDRLQTLHYSVWSHQQPGVYPPM